MNFTAIDPEHVVPSWQEFEQQGGDVIELPTAVIESLDRWTLERLGAYTASARALVTSAKQLAELGVEAKHQSVLAVPWCCKGSLTRRVA